MNIVLFTWHPNRFPISDRQWEREIHQIQDCGFLYSQWSVGNSTRLVKPNDIALLLRQNNKRGIVARGVVTSEVFEELSWNDELEEHATDHYVDITWTEQIPIDQRLTIETLEKSLPQVSWVRQASGTTVEPAYHEKLLKIWDNHVATLGLTKTPATPGHQPAGQLAQQQHGLCSVCGIDVAVMYQSGPQDFLTTTTFPSSTNQIAVCPNCKHFQSMFPAASTPEELKNLMVSQF